MKGYLLDVNVLIALAWPSHVHHRPAHRWFRAHHAEGWATSPLTQTSFVRLSCNPAVVSEAASPREAAALLGRMAALPGHRFWADRVDWTGTKELPTKLLLGHRQVTDAHLLALAIRNRGKLATLDAGVRSLIGDDEPARGLIELIPA